MKKIIFLALVALAVVLLAFWISGKSVFGEEGNGYSCEQQTVYEHQDWVESGYSYWDWWTWSWKWVDTSHWDNWEEGQCDSSPCNQQEVGIQHRINNGEWLDGVCPEAPGLCPTQCGLPESTVPDGLGGTKTCPTIECLDPCRAGQSYTGDYCGWSPKPWEPEEYKPSVCTAALPNKPSFILTRVDSTHVKATWNETDENTTGWTLSWGYSETNLPYGNGGNQLPVGTTEFTIGNLLPNTKVWVELSRWNGNDCAVYSNRVNM